MTADRDDLIAQVRKRIEVADRVAATGRAPHAAVYLSFELAEQVLQALLDGPRRQELSK